MNDILLAGINKCINRALEKEVQSLCSEMSLIDDLGMESLQLVTLQVELEDEFDIEFDPLEDDFYEIFQTIGTVYQTVKSKLS